MNMQNLLSVRERELSNLLNRIVESLEGDSQVRAVWLSGSMSRGDYDALSDIDIHVVVSDEAIRDVVENRRAHAARIAHPVLLMDNLANAPPDGAYLLAHYAGEVGPLHVDWFWQPELGAEKPDDERIIFDRANLPVIRGEQWRRESHRPPAPPLDTDELIPLLTHKITFFWAMSVIVAKYIARRNGETAARLTRLLARTINETSELLDNKKPLSSAGLLVEGQAPSKQFEGLYVLAENAKGLHGDLSSFGAKVPFEAVPHIYRFFRLAKAMVAS